MLTIEHLRILQRPFSVHEHEFKDGRVYIRERAICRRIEQVDLDWSLGDPIITYRDNAVIVKNSLTILGVTRYGVGMDKVNSANEAEKSAATDVLKRCARLFGIGRYLLDTPGYVKDHKALEKWLKSLNEDGDGDDQPAENEATPEPAPAEKAEPLPRARKREDDPVILGAQINGAVALGAGSTRRVGGTSLAEHFEASDFVTSKPIEVFSDPIDRVTIKKTAKGAVFYTLAGCSVFKTDVWELLGYDQYTLTQVRDPGVVILPDPVRVAYLPADDAAGRKYNEALRVFRPINQNKVVIKDLAS
jgi:hypothetical protein